MKIIICGCCGKMGKCLVELINKSENDEVVAGIDSNLSKKFDFPIFKNTENLNIDADAIIDFSNPLALNEVIKLSKNKNIPAVICTTGFSENQISEIKKLSEHVAVFYSRNMSIGVNLLLNLAKKATEFLNDDFDIEIIEKHHNQKIDAPSGTALMIAEKIKEVKKDSEFVFDRTKSREKRKKSEIGIHCIRAGTICGEHEVLFAGENEILSITHKAQSRTIFASGAIKAAKFIVSKPAGLYDMQDLLFEK